MTFDALGMKERRNLIDDHGGIVYKKNKRHFCSPSSCIEQCIVIHKIDSAWRIKKLSSGKSIDSVNGSLLSTASTSKSLFGSEIWMTTSPWASCTRCFTASNPTPQPEVALTVVRVLNPGLKIVLATCCRVIGRVSENLLCCTAFLYKS